LTYAGRMPRPKAAPRPAKTRAAAAPARAANKRSALASSPLATRLLAKLRPICLSLPGTEEVEAWGHPTFRVAGKIFAGFGANDQEASMSVKTSFEMQASLVATDARFRIAAYVGKHGWVELDLSDRVDWGEVEALVGESYRLVAPSKLTAATGTLKAPAARKPPPGKKASTRRTTPARKPIPARAK
jgi:predicted DNA-binding protein (MmcQ/YjbR family)